RVSPCSCPGCWDFDVQKSREKGRAMVLGQALGRERWRIRAATVWTSGDEPPRTGVDVIVDGQYITAIVPRANTAKGEKLLDLGGLTLVPGFIDAHLHLWGAGPPSPWGGAPWASAYRAVA